MNAFIFSGFLLQYIKDRAFQLEIQAAINNAQQQMPDMVSVSQYVGVKRVDSNDRWFIKLFKAKSAANYVFYIMLVSLFVHLGISIIFILQAVGILPIPDLPSA